MTEQMSKRVNSVCSIVSLIVAGLINLVHFPLFVIASAEQIQTGWGYGTNFEMGVLYWWIAEFLMIIPLLVTAALFVVSLVKRDYRTKILFNAVLFVLFVLQVVVTNIFFIY